MISPCSSTAPGVDVMDDTGKSPIDVAAGNRGGEGHTRSAEIVALLKSAGVRLNWSDRRRALCDRIVPVGFSFILFMAVITF